MTINSSLTFLTCNHKYLYRAMSYTEINTSYLLTQTVWLVENTGTLTQRQTAPPSPCGTLEWGMRSQHISITTQRNKTDSLYVNVRILAHYNTIQNIQINKQYNRELGSVIKAVYNVCIPVWRRIFNPPTGVCSLKTRPHEVRRFNELLLLLGSISRFEKHLLWQEKDGTLINTRFETKPPCLVKANSILHCACAGQRVLGCSSLKICRFVSIRFATPCAMWKSAVKQFQRGFQI